MNHRPNKRPKRPKTEMDNDIGQIKLDASSEDGRLHVLLPIGSAQAKV